MDVDLFEDELCVVLFDIDDGVLVYGTFNDEEEARTFIACGPHGMEDHDAVVQPLYAPHALKVELTSPTALLDVSG